MFETNGSSRLWITHFTPEGTPAELTQVGETLKTTLTFVPSNVTTNPIDSRGLRIGLFNFSETGATRVNADGFSTFSGGGAPGANVTGYMLNLNFAQVFTINNPIEFMKRTDLPTNNLMGTRAVFARIGSTGGGNALTPGFSNDVLYTIEFSVRSLGDSNDLTCTISDTNGWSISHTVTDSILPVKRFDSLAIRPTAVLDTADALSFRRFKAEIVPFVPRVTGIVLNPDVLSVTINWESLPGKTYQLEYAATVDAATWDAVGTVTTIGSTGSMDDPNGPFENQRFYRVQQLP